MNNPSVNKRLTAILADGAAATCLPLDLEDGRSARTFKDGMAIRALRAQVMTDMPLSPGVTIRARDLQLALTQREQHPAASPVDLITAATAAEYGAIVLRYDREYDLIAQIGGARSQWVAPAGSVL
jgi:hypothetical protein